MMHKQDSSEKFEKAGAQAAEVLGRFMQFASDLNRDFNVNTPHDHTDTNSNRENRHYEEGLQELASGLRELRESAGYTLEGFASALEAQLKREPVADKINAVENGQSEFPAHWLQAVASVLTNGDVDALFNNEASQSSGVAQRRLQRIVQLFENDSDLADLSDDQFDKLEAHMEVAYQSAKKLL